MNIIDFLCELTRIVCANKIYIFAHTNAYSRKNDPFGRNLGSLYYESVNSPFLLWKLYFDVLCRIIFNQTDRHILPILLPDPKIDCRKFTACNEQNCSGLKINKIKAIFYSGLVSFYRRLCELSCSSFNAPFVIYPFQNYKKRVDFFSSYLEIER